MNDELRAEYDFDYSQAKPNRFAESVVEGGTMVVLDADVAEHFHDGQAVNDALRAIISASADQTG